MWCLEGRIGRKEPSNLEQHTSGGEKQMRSADKYLRTIMKRPADTTALKAIRHLRSMRI